VAANPSKTSASASAGSISKAFIAAERAFVVSRNIAGPVETSSAPRRTELWIGWIAEAPKVRARRKGVA
jgi:hypothetical protein